MKNNLELAQKIMREATPAQVEAYKRKIDEWKRSPDEVTLLVGDASCIMIRFGTLWIGIEKDGHAHS
jgi:hypothetical protein